MYQLLMLRDGLGKKYLLLSSDTLSLSPNNTLVRTRNAVFMTMTCVAEDSLKLLLVEPRHVVKVGIGDDLSLIHI